MSGLIDSIKNDVKKAGTSKGAFTYIREGQKVRVRFLQEMDDGMEITFHDSFKDGINVPCQDSTFGRPCPYCEDERVRTRSLYAWCVYNYESKRVEIFMFAVNSCSPIPALLAMHENYGTITDRDYVISVSGKGPEKTYQVVPMDKQKFRNTKAQPFSKKKILQLLDKAYPCDEEGEEDDNEDDVPVKKSNTKKRRPQVEEEDEDDDGDWEDDGMDYQSMSPIELYRECKKRKMDVEPKKSAKYYIRQLEEYDKQQDDWGDSEDDDSDDDWDDEGE